MDFSYSPKVIDLQQRLTAFMDEHIYPAESVYHAEVDANRAAGNAWLPTKVMEELKAKARAAGLWNLFLPESKYGAGLTNLEYAPLCEIMGRSHVAPEAFNCSAPDTGNMETLVRYATEAQQQVLQFAHTCFTFGVVTLELGNGFQRFTGGIRQQMQVETGHCGSLWTIRRINHGTNAGTSSEADSMPARRTPVRHLWTGGNCYPQAGDSRDNLCLTRSPTESRCACPLFRPGQIRQGAVVRAIHSPTTLTSLLRILIVIGMESFDARFAPSYPAR